MLGLLTLVVGGALLLSGKKTVDKLKNLTYNFEGVQLAHDKNILDYFKSVSLLLSISVNNPNDGDVRFKSFVGDVFGADGKVLAHIDFVSDVIVLKAKQTTSLKNIPVKIQSISAIKLLMGEFGSKPIKLKVVGTLKTDGLPLPVNETFSIKK